MSDDNRIDDLVASIIRGCEHLLPIEDVQEALSFVEHGEPGVALEFVCDQLYESDAKPPPDVLSLIKTAADRMKLKRNSIALLVGTTPGG